MSFYVDPHMQPILEQMRAAPAIDYRSMPIPEARATFERLAAPWNEGSPDVFAISALKVPGGAGFMRARLYRPKAGKLPLVLFVHGGGWTFGSVDSHDGTMRRLALESGCAVLGIDYRLSPDHPFPAPLDDVLAALAFAEKGGLGDDVDATRIALAGDSAGGNLALGALLARRDTRGPMPRTAALFYGCYEPLSTSDSHRNYGGGAYALTTANMEWYWANFLGPNAATPSTVAAPARASLAGLPPLYLNAAGLDPLLDDTLNLSRRLSGAGIRHRFDLWPGVVHGFLRMGRDLPAAREATKAAGEYLRDALA